MAKVIDFAAKKRELEKKKLKKEELELKDQETNFEEIMKRNADNKERVRKERNQANESVKRSYRIRSERKPNRKPTE